MDSETSRAAQITDSDFPDQVGVVGGPLVPCKVTEFTASTAPMTRIEGTGHLDATYEQTRQYVIRVRPKPVEVTYMAGASDEEIEQARLAVLETALGILDEQPDKPGHLPTVVVGQEPTPEYLLVLRAYRHAHGQPTVGAPAVPTAAEVNQAVTWWNQRQAHAGDVLTSADPEPGHGATVRDAHGNTWRRTDDGDRGGAANWERTGVDYFEPESWTKVAGNYGPVKVVSAPNG